jgi:acetoin utilization protein AcuB
MAEFRVNHLPIVNDKQFLGLVSDEDLVEVQESNALLLVV